MQTKYFQALSDMRQCSWCCLGIVDFSTWEQPWNRFLSLSVLSLPGGPFILQCQKSSTVVGV